MSIMRYFVDTTINRYQDCDKILMNREVFMWLGTNIGNPEEDWKWRTTGRKDNPDRFYFTNIEDKAKFILWWL